MSAFWRIMEWLVLGAGGLVVAVILRYAAVAWWIDSQHTKYGGGRPR